MLTAKTVKGLADRLAKAEALVAEGAVTPVANLDNYYVVRNGDGTQHYLVRVDEGHEHCTCPDYTERQSKLGLPCKHLMAAQIAAVNGHTTTLLGAQADTRPVEEPAAAPTTMTATEAAGKFRTYGEYAEAIGQKQPRALHANGRSPLAVLTDDDDPFVAAD